MTAVKLRVAYGEIASLHFPLLQKEGKVFYPYFQYTPIYSNILLMLTTIGLSGDFDLGTSNRNFTPFFAVNG